MSQAIHSVLIAFTTRISSDGLACVINNFEGFTVTKSFPIENRILDNFPDHSHADFLVMEVNCPGKRDLDYIRRVREAFPQQRIVLISNLPRHNVGIDLLESGISAYLLKSCGKEDLQTALHKVIEGKPYFCSEITKNLLATEKLTQQEIEVKLTDREKEVLGMLVNSYSNKQIAFRLKLSENTIKTHRKNIHAKFGGSNLIGLVRYACRSNLIDFGSDGFCLVCPYVHL